MSKNNFKEQILIKDSLSVRGSLCPTLFKNEYLIYKDGYLEEGKEKDLIMAYILLQIYLENHFHYYLWLIVGGGLGPLRIDDWKEGGWVEDKINKFSEYLYQHGFVINSQYLETIQSNFKTISAIRNALAHGHPITETIAGGQKDQSRAKTYLNRQKFNEIRQLANDTAHYWNLLMCDIQSQEKLLKNCLPSKHFFDNCKFEVF